MPVDPRQVAQGARVIAALKQFGDDWASDDEARSRDYLLATICAAHLDALAAGEEGLDVPKAHEDLSRQFGRVTNENEYELRLCGILDRQHRAICGALRAKLGAAEAREKAWTEGLHYGINLKKADYAPLVAAIREVNDARADLKAAIEGHGHPTVEQIRRCTRAVDDLAALPLPEVTP